jgi:hypothetical protein
MGLCGKIVARKSIALKKLRKKWLLPQSIWSLFLCKKGSDACGRPIKLFFYLECHLKNSLEETKRNE